MLKRVAGVILQDIEEKRGRGNDFNSIVLIQKENTEISKKAKLVQKYMVGLILQMRRAANHLIKMIELLMDDISEGDNKVLMKKYQKELEKAENEHNVAMKELKNYLTEMNKLTGKTRDHINMNKVNYLNYEFDKFM